MLTFFDPKIHPRHSGTSLVEILVALLILAVGMLSMAALHTSSTRYGKLAEFRSNAAQLAEDLNDRMRSNPTGVRNGNYVYTPAWSATPALKTVPAISPCADASCAAQAAQAVALSDLVQWNNAAVPLLPGAALYTQQIGLTVMNVWVGWQEPAASAGNPNAAADATINGAYTCPPAMGATADVRCMFFRFML